MYPNLKNKVRKIGIYVAHDDDSILGVGGRIVQHLKNGDEVYIVICTDGRNSHKAVLGIEENPSVWEVKAKKAEEIREAAETLGVTREKLYFLELTDGEGKVWQDEERVKRQIIEITKKEKADLIYFHHPDAHVDHRAVSKIVLEVLKDLESKPEAYRFFIWTKELAKGRPEVSEEDAPKIPEDALKIDISGEVDLKQKALYKMKSQVVNWPYIDWQVQAKPILNDAFINYFLRGEEIFVKVKE